MKFQGSKKYIPLLKIQKQSDIGCTDKISLVKCKSILESTGISYEDEEVELIRDFFYQLASIGLENESLDKKSISDNSLQNLISNNEKGNNLC